MMEIQVIDDLELLPRLANTWASLGAIFPTPLLQFEWFVSCAEALYSPGQIRVVTLLDNGRVTAIAPLARVHRRYGQWLELMGTTRLYEPAGLLYETETGLEELIRRLVSLGYPLDLGRLSTDSPLLKGPSWHTDRQGLWLRRPGANSCVLTLQSGWEAIWRDMSKSRRIDFQRLKRRADEKGGYRMDTLTPSPEQVESVFKQAMDIEAASWKSTRGTCLKNDSSLANFFIRYCQRMANLQAFYVFFLRLGEELVAMHLAVEHTSALWILKIGYDERMRHLSPGLFLTLNTVRHAADKGLARFEFLGSEESWQHMWPVERQRHNTLIFMPWTVRGIRGGVDIVADGISNRFGKRKNRWGQPLTRDKRESSTS